VWFDAFIWQVGVLVDLDERHEVPIARADLATSDSVPEKARHLYPGEFVEYEPSASRAAEGGRGGWVSGLLEWPLMCESVATASRPLVSAE
jgi:hypothetical protein